MKKKCYTLYVGSKGVAAHWSDESRVKAHRKGIVLKRVPIIAGPGKEKDGTEG